VTKLRATTLAALAIALALAAPTAAAPSLPAGYTAKPVIAGLTHPTAVRFARDGRVFVSEQGGQIAEYDDLSDTTPTLVADMRADVYEDNDLGLLGMALDPKFPARPYLYVLYTYDAPPGGTAPTYGTSSTLVDGCPQGGTTGYCLSSAQLARLRISKGSNATGERVLLNGWCGQFDSHSIGTLAFDSKGRLYAGAGEGANFTDPDYGQFGSPPNPCGDPGGANPAPPTAEGGALRAQDLYLGHDPVGLDGSIIRMNPRTGAGSKANPLTSSDDPNARRIVGYGFRNPFRFTVDPRTEDLWVGDVGWTRTEEIDHVRPDHLRDYGWPCYEGDIAQPKYKDLDLNGCERLYASGKAKLPVFTYAHGREVVAGDGCPRGIGSAISGIAMEHGSSFTRSYRHALFFQDAVRGCMWAMRAGRHGTPDPNRVSVFATGLDSPVDLEFGPGGALYYVDVYAGDVVRIKGPGN
jgi:glucose/arabinose dehydrogenase